MQRYVEKLPDRGRTERVRDGLRARRETGVLEQGVRLGLRGDAITSGLQVLRLVVLVVRRHRIGLGEHGLPRLVHLPQGIEAAVCVAMECPPEERRQSLLQGRLEDVLRDHRVLVVGGTGIGHLVAPAGALSGRHLVQGDRCGVVLGMVVEDRSARCVEERVEVAAGACLHVPFRRLREGEVEKHQLPGPIGPLEHAEVVGLEVTVPHPLAGQLVEGGEEVTAEALQLVVRQAPVSTQSGSE